MVMKSSTLYCLKEVKELSVNGSLKPNLPQMAISNDRRLNLLPKIIVRKMTLTTNKSFLLSRGLIKNYYDFSSLL